MGVYIRFTFKYYILIKKSLKISLFLSIYQSTNFMVKQLLFFGNHNYYYHFLSNQ